MDDRPKIECDVHDLLDEANVLLLIRSPNAVKARELIGRLRHCAQQAKVAGEEYAEAEGRLRGAADALELKVGADKPSR